MFSAFVSHVLSGYIEDKVVVDSVGWSHLQLANVRLRPALFASLGPAAAVLEATAGAVRVQYDSEAGVRVAWDDVVVRLQTAPRACGTAGGGSSSGSMHDSLRSQDSGELRAALPDRECPVTSGLAATLRNARDAVVHELRDATVRVDDWVVRLSGTYTDCLAVTECVVSRAEGSGERVIGAVDQAIYTPATGSLTGTHAAIDLSGDGPTDFDAVTRVLRALCPGRPGGQQCVSRVALGELRVADTVLTDVAVDLAEQMVTCAELETAAATARELELFLTFSNAPSPHTDGGVFDCAETTLLFGQRMPPPVSCEAALWHQRSRLHVAGSVQFVAVREPAVEARSGSPALAPGLDASLDVTVRDACVGDVRVGHGRLVARCTADPCTRLTWFATAGQVEWAAYATLSAVIAAGVLAWQADGSVCARVAGDAEGGTLRLAPEMLAGGADLPGVTGRVRVRSARVTHGQFETRVSSVDCSLVNGTLYAAGGSVTVAAAGLRATGFSARYDMRQGLTLVVPTARVTYSAERHRAVHAAMLERAGAARDEPAGGTRASIHGDILERYTDALVAGLTSATRRASDMPVDVLLATVRARVPGAGSVVAEQLRFVGTADRYRLGVRKAVGLVEQQSVPAIALEDGAELACHNATYRVTVHKTVRVRIACETLERLQRFALSLPQLRGAQPGRIAALHIGALRCVVDYDSGGLVLLRSARVSVHPFSAFDVRPNHKLAMEYALHALKRGSNLFAAVWAACGIKQANRVINAFLGVLAGN